MKQLKIWINIKASIPSTLKFTIYNCAYDAAGIKLRKQTKINNAPENTLDYIGNFVYENLELKYILTGEGRVMINSDRTFEYQYFLKDYLGNTRVTFTQNNEIIQEDTYYPFGMQMNGLCNETVPDYKNKYLYNGKELQDEFGLEWYDYGKRFYDAELGRWHVIDPLSDSTYSWSTYKYALNNPLKFVDPDGMLEDWVERTDKKGNKSIVYDPKVTSATDPDLKKSDTYLDKAVVVMDGSQGEQLDSQGTLTGKGAKSAKTTIYGPGGANDIQTYDGLTVTSDPNSFTPIASGDYEGSYQPMATSPYGKNSLTYRIKTLNGSTVLPTQGNTPNKDKSSVNYGQPVKSAIFLHRTNHNGFAGSRVKPNGHVSAVSRGCPVIDGRQWKRVESQLGKISSFRLRIIR